MAGVPKADAAEAPAADDFSNHARTAQIRLARAEGELVDRIYGHIVAHIEDTRAFVAGQAIHVLRSVGLTPSDGTIVDGMRPSVA